MHAPTTNTETTTDTASSSVPLTPGRPAAARYWAALAIAVVVLVAALVGASLVEVPYATLAPGSARDSAPLISVDGVPTFEPDGAILFLTVGVDDDVSLLEAATAWVDPDIDVLPIEAVIPQGRTEEENQQLNLEAMVGSKQTAAVVALTRLGYALNPSGTGALVVSIEPGTPAAEHLTAGDTIVSVDGAPISLFSDLTPTVSARRPGERVVLTVESVAGDRREVEVALASRPDDPEAGFLGIGGDTRAYDPGLPFPVDIDSGRVVGPSAGLAFTLAILDVLTDGQLTGGRRVAVTGTINENGTVGEVGGVTQKAAAAANAGAEVLLVPPGELEAALAHPHGLEIISVATLDEALQALVELGGDPLPSAPNAA